MKITVFTSNQPRHLALVNRLLEVADEVVAVLECNTVFPGQVADAFGSSAVMREYFSGVVEAERYFFGGVAFTSPRTRVLALRAGDLNHLSWLDLLPALDSDMYVVFGASYIKGWLVDYLIEHQALNIHMGLSPYYRGSSCNFWALYDGNPQLVGATIHFLSKGLDSGPMIRHAIPSFAGEGPSHFTMKAVVAAFEGLIATIQDASWQSLGAVPQDRSLEVRYSRSEDFTDDVAFEFMQRAISDSELSRLLMKSVKPHLLHPVKL